MRMTRTALAALAAGAAVAATLALPGTASAAPSGCLEEYVCFYSGKDYTGDRCIWSQSDPDWWNGFISCSWADDKNVKSVFNNGTSDRFTGVAYYLDKDYEDRVGCTKQGKGGNLAGTYKVRSHRWIDGSCGS